MRDWLDTMTDLTRWYELRERIVGVLEGDLMGGPADAVLDEPPLDRFVLGILHPQGGPQMDEADSETDAADAGGSADAVFDPAIALARMRYPSSMGMTFAVDTGLTTEIVIEVSAARYDKSDDEQEWTRAAVHCDPVSLGTSAVGQRTIEVADGLQLYTVVRTALDGVAPITVVLLNSKKADKGRRDHLCWFQPELSVRTTAGAFVSRRLEASAGLDDADLDSYALLFRDVEDLAVGHGCAVAWNESRIVQELRSTFLPWHDVKLAEHSGGGGIELPMSLFRETSGYDTLRELVEDYRRWIVAKEAKIPTLDASLRLTAQRHLADATEAADRIARGIAVLEGDRDAARAFALMNRAMELQRQRQDTQHGAAARPQSWRPFQMAFILLNLEGLTEPNSADRELADLLWFPTGGGKTEAYLGLIGYSILLDDSVIPKTAESRS